MPKYIYQYENWSDFEWDDKVLQPLLARVRNLQGRLFGQMAHLGFSLKEEAMLGALTLDVLKSFEIEGERLNKDQVRSSVARHLGLEVAGMVNVPRDLDGVVEVMLEATQNYQAPLTEERLFAWHAALFPHGFSHHYKIEVAQYRTGDMQVVSGAMGKERVHYEAPKADVLPHEMKRFLEWFNAEDPALDSVLKAAVAHFWFVTLHPFDDGNGRMARAIADMQLARSDSSSQRFYSMSNQILNERKMYYSVLQKSQWGHRNITLWLEWFLSCMERALLDSEHTLQSVLYKAKFWELSNALSLNERQRIMLNKLLDGFDGKLTSSKWAKMTKVSADTALRDIQDLIKKGLLQKEAAGGRSTNYELVK